MKAMKLCSIMLGLLLATAVQASVEINEETFPDETFRSLIASLPEGKDGILTDEEIEKKMLTIGKFASQNDGGNGYPGTREYNYSFCKRDEFWWEISY